MAIKQQLLLIKDIDDLGKSGEIVSVKPGYARNYLLPLQKAVIATKHTLRMQEKLKEERFKRATIDRAASEELAKKIENITLTIHVKVDPEGKMYGSVSVQDIIDLFAQEKIGLERRNVQLKHSIKETGVFDIELKLKEGIPAKFHLKILPEAGQDIKVPGLIEEVKVEEEIVEEKPSKKAKEKTEEESEEQESE